MENVLLSETFIKNFKKIREGLIERFDDYILYYKLGLLYREVNVNQAYLCMLQSLYYCDNSNDKVILNNAIEEIKNEKDFRVHPFSVVLLSYNRPQKIKSCLETLFSYADTGDMEVIVVDNASTEEDTINYLRSNDKIKLIELKEKVSFSEGNNIGILNATPQNDIFLLSNDTVIIPNSVFYLRMGLYSDENVGTVGPLSNYAKNAVPPNLPSDTDGIINEAFNTCVPKLKNESLYENRCFLSSFALMIKYEAMEITGLLDQRFCPAYFEDVDYCIRILKNGLKNLLVFNSFIVHDSDNIGGVDRQTYDIIIRNYYECKKKWGFDISYYSYARDEIVELFPDDTNIPLSVFEAGCGIGATLSYIKRLYPLSSVRGLEINPDIAALGKSVADIRCGNIEELSPYDMDIPIGSLDVLLFGDVLEHLIRPDEVLKKFRPFIKEGGAIYASIPNVSYGEVVMDLIKGNFTYQDSGILDRTHMRFFTKKEIFSLFENAGYRVTIMNRKLSPCEETKKLEPLIRAIDGSADIEDFNTYQYIIKAEPVFC